MHHVADSAQPVDRIEIDDGMRRVGQADRGDLPFAETERQQRGGSLIDARQHAAVSHFLTHERDSRIFRIALDSFREDAVQGVFRIVQMLLEPGIVMTGPSIVHAFLLQVRNVGSR